MKDTIYRQDAIDAMEEPCKVSDTWTDEYAVGERMQWEKDVKALNGLPSAQPEHLTDDDFETIRIHLNAYKENLCNQRRWKEAEEYQRIIDRFMEFASAEPKKGEWTTEEVAEILARVLGDECACNFNGIDEWLPSACKYADTECPTPKEKHGCWMQFLMQVRADMRGEGSFDKLLKSQENQKIER